MKKYYGFALLEVFLAVIILGISLGGGYYMYQSILTQQKNSKTVNEIIAMSSIFSDLYLAHLTSDINTSSKIINAFYGSGRIPENFFSNTTSATGITMLSPYGALQFSFPGGTKIPGSTFSVTVPVSENTDSAKNQICDPIKNYVQSCKLDTGTTVTINIDASS